MTDLELGKILDVSWEELPVAVREFVSTVIELRGALLPIVFLRATRRPDGTPLDTPTLATVPIPATLDLESNKVKISEAVRAISTQLAAQWVAFFMPGTMKLDDVAREVVLIAIDSDEGSDAFAAFVERDPAPIVKLVQRIEWTTAQTWLEGLLSDARLRRLDLS